MSYLSVPFEGLKCSMVSWLAQDTCEWMTELHVELCVWSLQLSLLSSQATNQILWSHFAELSS